MIPDQETASVAGFDWQPRTRLVFGAGAVERLGQIALDGTDARRVLLVTDQGIVAAGHAARAQATLEAAGLTVAVWDGTRENPTTDDVDACVRAARDADANWLIAIGGGSSIDTAKGANFLLTGGGVMRDYQGLGRMQGKMLPLIAVPTTAGTGSECQSFALIADAVTHQKMACGDHQAAPRVALLDPALTVSQPPRVTAHAGLDAIAHAVESRVTRARNPVSMLYSREAFRLLTAHFADVFSHPNDLEARGGMLLGAAYAGLAIENSMLGAAHSLANPLTAHFGVVHGQAVALMLPHVVRFNAHEESAREGYQELAVLIGLATWDTPAHDAVEALARLLTGYLWRANVHTSLTACGVTAEAIPVLAAEATAQRTAQFNPRAATVENFAALYRAAL